LSLVFLEEQPIKFDLKVKNGNSMIPISIFILLKLRKKKLTSAFSTGAGAICWACKASKGCIKEEEG
jgi:hypothetical protein